MVSELGRVLEKNYDAIGWKLFYVALLPTDQGFLYLHGKIGCPCGGKEYFTMMLHENAAKHQIELLAENILQNTASRSHLQKDVETGALSPMDIDKHCFRGLV